MTFDTSLVVNDSVNVINSLTTKKMHIKQAIIDEDLLVGQDLMIEGHLIVQEMIDTPDLIVNRQTDLMGNLHVHAETRFDKTVIFDSPVYFQSETNLKFDNVSNLNVTSLHVEQVAAIDNIVHIVDNVQLLKTLRLDGELFVSKQTISSHVDHVDNSITHALMITKDMFALHVPGSFLDCVDFDANVAFNAPATFTSDVVFKSSTTFDNDVVFNQNITFEEIKVNSVIHTGSLLVQDDTRIQGPLQVSQVAHFDSNINVDDSVIIKNTLNVKDVRVLNNLDVMTRLNTPILSVDDDAIMNTLHVNNVATFEKHVNMTETLRVDRVQVHDTVQIENQLLTKTLFVKDETNLNELTVEKNAVFDQDVHVRGSIYLNQLNVTDTLSINRINVSEDTNLNGILNVHAKSIFSDLSYFNDNVIFFTDVHAKGKMFFESDVRFDAPATWFNTTLFLESITMNAPLHAQKNVRFDDHVDFDGTVSFKQPLTFNTHVDFENNVIFENDVTFNKKSTMYGPVAINKSLMVAGPTHFLEHVYFDQPADFQEHVAFFNNVQFDSKVTFDSSLICNGQSVFNDMLIVNDQMVVSYGLFDTMHVESFALFDGHVLFENTVDVNGILTSKNIHTTQLHVLEKSQFGEDATFESNVNVNKQFHVKNIHVSEKLIVQDLTQLSELYVNDHVTIEGELQVNNNVIIMQSLQSKNMQVKQNLIVDQHAHLLGDLNVHKNTHVVGDLHVDDNTSLQHLQVIENTILLGSVMMQSPVMITKSLFIQENTEIGKHLIVNELLHAKDDVHVDLNLIVDQHTKTFDLQVLNDISTSNIDVSQTADINSLNVNQNVYIMGKTTLDDQLKITQGDLQVASGSFLLGDFLQTSPGEINIDSLPTLPTQITAKCRTKLIHPDNTPTSTDPTLYINGGLQLDQLNQFNLSAQSKMYKGVFLLSTVQDGNFDIEFYNNIVDHTYTIKISREPELSINLATSTLSFDLKSTSWQPEPPPSNWYEGAWSPIYGYVRISGDDTILNGFIKNNTINTYYNQNLKGLQLRDFILQINYKLP